MSLRVSFGATTRIVERHSTVKRIVFGLIGLMPLLAPYELWRGLWPPTLVTPFLAAIALGALAVGGLCLAGAIFGYDQAWSIGDGAVVVRRRAPVIGDRREYRRADVAAVDVIRRDWNDGDASFAVALTLATGARLETPSLPDEPTAEKLRAEIERHLR